MENINWIGVLLVYIFTALGIFAGYTFYYLLENEYICKDKWIKITSISLFWPIYVCKKITEIIIKIFGFLFEVLRKLINDIFKL